VKPIAYDSPADLAKKFTRIASIFTTKFSETITMKIQIIKSIASGACALSMCLTLLSGSVFAQSVNTPSVSGTATTATLPEVTPVPVAKKAESAENPYGIEALWKTSDSIAKTVLVLLAIMSISSWYVTIVKVIDQTKMLRQARAASNDFWNAGTVEQGMQALEESSPFRFVAEAATSALKRHDGLRGHIPLNDWISLGIQRAVDRVQGSTRKGLNVLATVGSVSPFVGLFGTVWGIYHALTAIGISGQASIDKVAGPVGEALIMTAIGLAVAVPAVLGYNWLIGRNKDVMDELRAFGQDLHPVVLGTVES
jgi:biopolymer transport protein ExbB